MSDLHAKAGVASLSRELWDSLEREASSRAPNESGGVLLGYWADPHQVVVTNAVGPGPRASHTRTHFRPDYAYQENEIARVYTASGFRLTYLGDWHSHPGGAPHMSAKDRQTLKRIASFEPARAPKALLAILAGLDTWELSIWSGEMHRVWWRTRLCVTRLQISMW